MSQTVGRRSVNAVQQLLAVRAARCTTCGRQLVPKSLNLRVHGAWFHQGCAEYRPRSTPLECPLCRGPVFFAETSFVPDARSFISIARSPTCRSGGPHATSPELLRRQTAGHDTGG
jgi:hypothetical protein